MHTPVDVTRRAVDAFNDTDADCVIALGGGSSIGLGKAIAVRTGAAMCAPLTAAVRRYPIRIEADKVYVDLS